MAASMNQGMEKNINASTISLDCFWGLAEMNREVRIKAAEKLLKSLIRSQKEGTILFDLSYSIDRLIKGLGSSRKAARQGFTLVLIQILRTFAEIDLKDILKDIEKLLPLTGNRSDIGNNAIGRALAFSAIVHSGKLKKNPDCVSDTIIALLSLYGTRSYIQQIIQTLLSDIFNQLNNDTFKQHVWPHLENKLINGWECCTPDILWLLFICSQSYPDILNSKFLKKYWNTPDVMDKKNFAYIAKIIKQSTLVHPHVHPVCTEIVKCCLKKKRFKTFWRTVIDENLFLSAQGEKIYLGFEILKMVLPLLEHQKQVQSVFSPNFREAFMRCALNCHHSLNNAASDMCDYLTRFVSETEDPDIQIVVLEVFLKPPGTILFDKLAKKKTLANIIFHLKNDAVKSYMKMLKAIFSGIEESKSDASTLDRKRSFAVHQISILVSHQAMKSDIAWKKEALQFLVLHSFFSIKESHEEISESSKFPIEISTSLREECRASLIRALEFLLKSSGTQEIHVQEKCEVMVDLLQYTDQLLNLVNNFILITDINLIKERWNSVVTMVRKLQKQKKKGGKLHESCAFQIIFVHLAFQLFLDPQQTSDTLQEFEECCKHALKGRHCKIKKLKDETIIEEDKDESQWIDVIVDLLLSLLSQSSQLARRIVMSAFPLFCPFLTTSTLDQITDVINPKKSSEEGLPLVEQNNDGETRFDSDTSENEKIEEGSVNEEFRKRIKLALGQTEDEINDSEHYLSDSEMCELDNALSAAFSSQKPVSNKKPTKEEIELLHFRLRCLDLLFLLLKSGPSLNHVIRLILPLVSSLEHGLRHKNQSFLAEKVTRLLQMIIKYKKWQNYNGVSQEELKTLLQFLMTKSKKVSNKQMQKNLSQLCAYIVLCSKKLHSHSENNVSDTQNGISKHWYVEEYKMLLKNFLENSASNIHTDMFSSLISICPETAWEFTDLLLDFAFNENFRLYKRTQTLGILLGAIKATEPLSILTSNVWSKFCSKLMPHVIKALQDIVSSKDVKTTYTIEILDILVTVAKISLQFDMNIFQNYKDIKNLQNLSPKQRQSLQKKGRKLWRKVSKIIGLQF